jgi:hypothetical protein
MSGFATKRTFPRAPSMSVFGGKRTWINAALMSAYDPKQTWPPRCRSMALCAISSGALSGFGRLAE